MNSNGVKTTTGSTLKAIPYIIVYISFMVILLGSFIAYAVSYANDKEESRAARNEEALVPELSSEAKEFVGTWKLVKVYRNDEAVPDEAVESWGVRLALKEDLTAIYAYNSVRLEGTWYPGDSTGRVTVAKWDSAYMNIFEESGRLFLSHETSEGYDNYFFVRDIQSL